MGRFEKELRAWDDKYIKKTLCIRAVQVEVTAGNEKIASQLLAKGLSECAKSGLLWAEAIKLEPRAQRKSKSVRFPHQTRVYLIRVSGVCC